MTRSESRGLAFELLYSLEIQKTSKDEQKEQINMFLESQEIKEQKVKEYIDSTINGIEKNKEEILKVNLALLELAIYEMIYTEVPYKVVVNEAVELAKKYGEESSPSFINGILANIIKQLGIANKE